MLGRTARSVADGSAGPVLALVGPRARTGDPAARGPVVRSASGGDWAAGRPDPRPRRRVLGLARAMSQPQGVARPVPVARNPVNRSPPGVPTGGDATRQPRIPQPKHEGAPPCRTRSRPTTTPSPPPGPPRPRPTTTRSTPPPTASTSTPPAT